MPVLININELYYDSIKPIKAHRWNQPSNARRGVLHINLRHLKSHQAIDSYGILDQTTPCADLVGEHAGNGTSVQSLM